MAHVHLIEGPVGAGKSTFAAQLSKAHAAPHLALDDWMATLFGPGRPDGDIMPWYVERKDRCIEQIWKIAQGLIDTGTDVILELGLIQRAARADFYARLDGAYIAHTVYVLDAPKEIRHARVRHRNETQGATFSMVVPDAIFELASTIGEPPDEAECAGRGIQCVATDAR
ncbi:MAG: ATP-binding protein [Alphaproteobacteria bacterium]